MQGFHDLMRYWTDAAWRTLATIDALRQRAANMREHAAAGMPPLLHFESETVAEGRDLQPPSNYRLLRITKCGTDALEKHVKREAAPVMVVDPRAGHGPGIGGFRRDSEVGMALLEGHPTYFVVFDPEPLPGQTVGAVVETLARFMELVASRHAGKPAIAYGNCQGGWSLVLALSHCSRQAGLVVLNGSPLSYWAGEPGVNPMRLVGGLTGGVWLAHLLADLGAGRFDGAWLVQNFEALRPEGVLKKYDGLFADPERERDRFLQFERWWNAYYFLGRDEILSIVRDLFIGNRLERGEVVVDGHCRADLTRIRTPLVIFSSHADNITPPPQALGWLRTVYPSTKALVAAGQRIVYLFSVEVGHLGIFVSADVAKREHRAILHHAAEIQSLPPGLYEMRIDSGSAVDAVARATFEPRRVEDIPFEVPALAFQKVDQLSARLDEWYAQVLSPVVRYVSTDQLARWMERAHPMRTTRLAWSQEAVPALQALPGLVEALRVLGAQDAERASNPWYRMERTLADAAVRTVESWRVMRDMTAELAFELAYAR